MMRFITTCVHSTAAVIDEVIERQHSIARATFCKHVDARERKDVERQLGYAVEHEKGLHMKDDCYVSYWRSIYRGRPCVGFDWSAIEHIFA